MTVFYTSDLHFNHRLVAMQKRGFASIGEHDEAVIANWNEIVGFTDTVYLLGDVAMNWKGAGEKIARLNGIIHLITGNHDLMFPGNRDAHKHQAKWIGNGMFDSIQAYARRKSGKHEFLLSHFPYHGEGNRDIPERFTQYRLRDEGMWLVHGHTHSKEKLGPSVLPLAAFGQLPQPRGRQVHAGLDAWDLRPVPEESILALMVDTAATGLV